MEIRLNESALQRLLSDPNGPVGQHMRRLAEDVAEQARQNAPVDSGRLRDSITVESSGDGGFEVRANAPYAGIVERNTGFLTNATRQVLGANALEEFVRGAAEQARKEVRRSQRRS